SAADFLREFQVKVFLLARRLWWSLHRWLGCLAILQLPRLHEPLQNLFCTWIVGIEVVHRLWRFCRRFELLDGTRKFVLLFLQQRQGHQVVGVLRRFFARCFQSSGGLVVLVERVAQESKAVEDFGVIWR